MTALPSHNVIVLTSGRVRLVCEFCDRRTGPRENSRLSQLPRGWSMAPYSATSIHRFDGSTGALYTCPVCDRAGLIGRFPMRGRGLVEPLPVLVERQVDGFACIDCGAEPTTMVPAVHPGPRGQLFYCADGYGCRA